MSEPETAAAADVDTALDPKCLAERAIVDGEDMDELEAFIEASRTCLAAAQCLGWASTILDMEDRLEIVEAVAERQLGRSHAGRRQRERAARVLELRTGDAEDGRSEP